MAQVLAIGNAIVDVIARVEDDFLAKHDAIKGSMMLIDSDKSTVIYDDMPPAIMQSGGSAANTAAGISALGGDVSYIGKVFNDQLGKEFTHDIKAQGVSFETAPLSEGDPTASCLVLVTPDAQRTMNTYLGACGDLTVDDIDPATVTEAEVTYIEGYLWDREHAKKAVKKALKLAKDAGREVALSLSDSFCVDRFRAEFLELVAGEVDILFANEDEIKSLYKTDDFDAALGHARSHVKVVCLTRGDKGCVIASGDHVHVIEAVATKIEDTTGAGDLFAAGFLFGYTNGYSLDDAGRIGGIAAAEIISHIGARPQADLKELLVSNLPVKKKS